MIEESSYPIIPVRKQAMDLSLPLSSLTLFASLPLKGDGGVAMRVATPFFIKVLVKKVQPEIVYLSATPYF